MPIFSWKGINKFGEEVCGSLQTKTSEELSQKLFAKGIAVLECKQQNKFNINILNIFQPKLNKSDLASFFEYLALLHESGLDLLGCLNISKQRTKNKVLHATISQLITEIDNGSTFSDALKQASEIFPDPIPQLITCGERTGKLGYVLTKITDHLRKQCITAQEIRQASMVPIITLFFAAIVSLIIFIFVIPQFESLFSSFNQELPLITRTVFCISNYMQGYTFGMVLFGIIVTIFILNRIIPWSYKASLKTFFMKNTPIIKNFYLLQNQTLTLQNIHLGLSVGLPLKDALTMAAKSTANFEFKSSIEYIAKELDSGSPLNLALNKANPKLLPKHTEALVAIGEQTGRLTSIFEKIYLITEQELFKQLKQATTLLQPILLVFVGIIIATLMLAIYFPIFSMAQVV